MSTPFTTPSEVHNPFGPAAPAAAPLPQMEVSSAAHPLAFAPPAGQPFPQARPPPVPAPNNVITSPFAYTMPAASASSGPPSARSGGAAAAQGAVAALARLAALPPTSAPGSPRAAVPPTTGYPIARATSGGTSSPAAALSSVSMRNLLGAAGSPDPRSAKGIQEFVNEFLSGPALIRVPIPAFGAPAPADADVPLLPPAPPFLHIGFLPPAATPPRTDYSVAALAADPRSLSLPGVAVLPCLSTLSRLVCDQQWAALDDLLPQSVALIERTAIVQHGEGAPSYTAYTKLSMDVAPGAKLPVSCDRLPLSHVVAYTRANMAALCQRQRANTAAADAQLLMQLLLGVFHQCVGKSDGPLDASVSVCVRALQAGLAHALLGYLECKRQAGAWEQLLQPFERVRFWATGLLRGDGAPSAPPGPPVHARMCADTRAPLLQRVFAALECWQAPPWPTSFLLYVSSIATLQLSHLYASVGCFDVCARVCEHQMNLAMACIGKAQAGPAPAELCGEYSFWMEAPPELVAGALAFHRHRVALYTHTHTQTHAGSPPQGGDMSAAQVLARLHEAPEWTAACERSTAAIDRRAAGTTNADETHAHTHSHPHTHIHACVADALEQTMHGDAHANAGNWEAAQRAYECAVNAAATAQHSELRDFARACACVSTHALTQLPVYSDGLLMLPSLTDLLCLTSTSCATAGARCGVAATFSVPLLEALVRSHTCTHTRTHTVAALAALYDTALDGPVTAARAKRLLQAVATKCGFTWDARVFRL